MAFIFTLRVRINNQIRSNELRVIDEEGVNLGIMSFADAFAKAKDLGLDLIEISPNAKPPIAKIMEHGKYQYLESKKQKKAKAGTKATETKAIQIKIATGDNDLGLKAKQASNWLHEGHRIKVELFLAGRAKYMNEQFLKERLDRVLRLISEPYKIAEDYKRGPKGLMIMIEKDISKKMFSN